MHDSLSLFDFPSGAGGLEPPSLEVLAARAKKRRVDLGLTQTGLASLMGRSPITVRAWETKATVKTELPR